MAYTSQIIRPERSADVETISAVTERAFRGAPHRCGAEHLIVDALRNSGALRLSLVAELEGVVVGHVAFSPVSISDGTQGWMGLGPLSVSPELQGRGVGSALVERGLELLRGEGAAGCVVLGDPKYYSRFGFTARPELQLPGVPAEYFQALALRESLPLGEVAYHAAFRMAGE